MSRYLTVVFEVNDEDSFKEHTGTFGAKIMEPLDAPWRVRAMSLDDEITRLDILEQASKLCDGKFIMDDIFSATDIANKTIEDFK